MARTVTVPLSEPIVGHGEPITEAKLREPTAGEYVTTGEVASWAGNPDGSTFRIENNATIAAYIELLIVEPKSASLLLAQASLVDGMRLREAVLDFFTTARTALRSPSAATS